MYGLNIKVSQLFWMSLCLLTELEREVKCCKMKMSVFKVFLLSDKLHTRAARLRGGKNEESLVLNGKEAGGDKSRCAKI